MKRRWGLAVLGALMAAAVIVSLLYASSYSTDRLRPIPAHAQLVYNHSSPEWFFSFIPTLGKDGDLFSKGWKKQFQTLEKRPLAVGSVPFGGRNRHAAWVAVSELGGPAALALRWRLMLFPPDSITAVRPYAVWSIWKFEHPSLPAWVRVRFCLTDGLLICSISENSRDIHQFLDTFDGRAESLADRRISK